MKIILCVGSPLLSTKALKRLQRNFGLVYSNYILLIRRTDPKLVEVIEALGDDSIENADDNTRLGIVEIPDDVEWYISCENGIELVCEKHRIWGPV